jgi:hypothetical protein
MSDAELSELRARVAKLEAEVAELIQFRDAATSVNEVFGETLAGHDERLTKLEKPAPPEDGGR